jgi:hypothetical protein
MEARVIMCTHNTSSTNNINEAIGTLIKAASIVIERDVFLRAEMARRFDAVITAIQLFSCGVAVNTDSAQYALQGALERLQRLCQRVEREMFAEIENSHALYGRMRRVARTIDLALSAIGGLETADDRAEHALELAKDYLEFAQDCFSFSVAASIAAKHTR